VNRADADITCPDVVVLERAAAGEPTDPELSVHIATCPRCRPELPRVRADVALLGGGRGACASDAPADGPAIAGSDGRGVV